MKEMRIKTAPIIWEQDILSKIYTRDKGGESTKMYDSPPFLFSIFPENKDHPK